MTLKSLSTTTKILMACAAAIALLWLLNIPFYSGASVGEHTSWRLEHGRVTVRRTEFARRPRHFYVAPNSEGLRWSAEFRSFSSGAWSVALPLWWLILPCVVGAGWIERRRAVNRASPARP
jgi:hypothetical protein